MLIRRILTIKKAAALGANIGLEHLAFIEGRLSVCGRKCLLLPPAGAAQGGLEQPRRLAAGHMG